MITLLASSDLQKMTESVRTAHAYQHGEWSHKTKPEP